LLVVLISGRGSNLRALVEAGLPVSAVVSSRADAAGLDFARSKGIATAVVEPKGGAREAFEAALVTQIERHKPRLVALAGFMHVLTSGFVEHYAQRMLNIHPSLLPAFPGLEAWRQALEYGVKVTGCTVHFATPEVDAGPILAQEAVAVLPDDTVETLHERIKAVERRLLVDVVGRMIAGELP